MNTEELLRDGFQGVRFGLVGGCATATHIIVAGAALWLIPELNVFIANLAGFLIAFWVSYFGHTHITFRKTGSVLKLLIVSCGGFIANNVILAALTQSGILTGFLAILVAVLAIPAGVFLASKYWVFTGTRS